MRKILIVFGTRPELIKLAPLYAALKKSPSFSTLTCSTGQHRELLAQAAEVFGIPSDFQLNLMKDNQDLFDITSSALLKMREVLNTAKPDLVIVQGDTSTALAAALSAFFLKIPVGHVEAGLRTGDSYSPFPEEMNRVLISKIACLHFAPTQRAMENLVSEGVPKRSLFLVGNTGIDAIVQMAKRAKAPHAVSGMGQYTKTVLLTMHRRENFGTPMENVFNAIAAYAKKHPSVQILYPAHPNPNVQASAHKILGNVPGIRIVKPLQFDELVWVLRECAFVVTDSGGLQEEAPTFGKPVLILRESTERQEAVDAGCAKLVGTDAEYLLNWMEKLSDSHSKEYLAMQNVKNPFGDGTASVRIVRILEEHFQEDLKRAA